MKTAPRLLCARSMCFRFLCQPMHFVSRRHGIPASTPTRFTDSCANAFCEYARSKPNSARTNSRFAQTSSSSRLISKGIDFYTLKDVGAVRGPAFMDWQIHASSTLSVNSRSSTRAAFVELAPHEGVFESGTTWGRIDLGIDPLF